MFAIRDRTPALPVIGGPVRAGAAFRQHDAVWLCAVLTAPWLIAAVGPGNCGQCLPATTVRRPDFLPGQITGADMVTLIPSSNGL